MCKKRFIELSNQSKNKAVAKILAKEEVKKGTQMLENGTPHYQEDSKRTRKADFSHIADGSSC